MEKHLEATPPPEEEKSTMNDALQKAVLDEETQQIAGYLIQGVQARLGMAFQGLDIFVFYDAMQMRYVVNAHWFAPNGTLQSAQRVIDDEEIAANTISIEAWKQYMQALISGIRDELTRKLKSMGINQLQLNGNGWMDAGYRPPTPAKTKLTRRDQGNGWMFEMKPDVVTDEDVDDALASIRESMSRSPEATAPE